jgi:hypothetical protein
MTTTTTSPGELEVAGRRRQVAELNATVVCSVVAGAGADRAVGSV